jgi:hypothetical protein
LRREKAVDPSRTRLAARFSAGRGNLQPPTARVQAQIRADAEFLSSKRLAADNKKPRSFRSGADRFN